MLTIVFHLMFSNVFVESIYSIYSKYWSRAKGNIRPYSIPTTKEQLNMDVMNYSF